MTDTVDVLRYARDVVLDPPQRWTKGLLARKKGDGLAAPHRSVQEGDRFCALGAVERARWELTGELPAESWVDAELSSEASALRRGQQGTWKCVGTYNDSPGTTFSDVISLFDDAIKTLEAPDRKDDK